MRDIFARGIERRSWGRCREQEGVGGDRGDEMAAMGVGVEGVGEGGGC